MNYKKIILTVFFLVVSVFIFNFNASAAKAMTSEEIQAMIQKLQDQIAQLQKQLLESESGKKEWCYNFRDNLKIGVGGADVEALHTVLEKEGFDISSDEKQGKKFDESTASAVSGFQQKYKDEILYPLGLKYPTGFVGNATRTKLSKLYGCGATPAKPAKPAIPSEKPAIPAEPAQPAQPAEPISSTACSIVLCSKGYEKTYRGVDELDCPVYRCILEGTTIESGFGAIRFEILDADGCQSCKTCTVGTTCKPCEPCPAKSTYTIYNAKITLYDVVQGKYVGTEDTSKGMAVFENLAYGDYTATISADGYESDRLSFSVGANIGTDFTVNIKKVSTTTSVNPPVVAVSSITVLSPNGKELLQKGTTQTIKWNSNNVSKIYIKLRKGIDTYSGKEGMVSDTIPNTGFFQWKVPSTLPDDNDYAIRVIDAAAGVLDDSDGPFIITSNTTEKNCAELQAIQQGYFNICSDSGYDNVCLNKFTGEYQGCTKNTRNDCTESNYYADKNILCPLSAVSRSINVISPNGGETWKIGETVVIKWSANGYSSEGVVRIILVDESTGKENPLWNVYNTGIHSWVVPFTYQPGLYRIKIVAPDEKYDTSDVAFNIASNPAIEVPSKTTGQSFDLEQMANILESARKALMQISEILKGI